MQHRAGSSRAEGMLFSVTASDPPTLIGVGAAILIVATVAAYVPARRAARIAPVAALRSD